ncbi:MAG: glutamyl-tRNA reductase [Halobacteria archaeon]|nr:glutamyl-tRNA reductase [Halobacteria archaeon]
MSEIRSLLVTHKWAEVNELEEVCKPDIDYLLESLESKKGIREAFVLQTCNRAEFYVTGDSPREALQEIADEIEIDRELRKYKGHTESVRHLMRLACGLESMVLGEDEILGQIREAYHEASEKGHLDSTLDTAIIKSIHLGERARSETRINEGNASMGSAAVEVAKERLGDLSGITVLVIGAGDMGELVSKALASRDKEYDDILVANRTFETAAKLADDIGGEPVKFAELSRHLHDADIVVTATGAPHPIFDKSDLDGHELLVVDLANPRDVNQNADELDDVDVVDIDDLSQVSDSSLQTRREAAERVEEMISDEMEVLERKLNEKAAQEMLSRIYSYAEGLRETETQRAFERLEENGRGLSDDEKEIINDLTRSLVSQLLSDPTKSLKKAAASEDYETLQSASRIFRLSDSESSEPPAPTGAREEVGYVPGSSES